MDAKFAQEVLTPLLNESESPVHLIVPVALRAALWLVDTDPQNNVLKQCEAQSQGKFRVTYLPVGVTRHADPTSEIKFHQYFPNTSADNARNELLAMADLNPNETTLLRGIDFGGASGVSMRRTMEAVNEALNVPREQCYIDTVIASDHAQRRADFTRLKTNRKRFAMQA